VCVCVYWEEVSAYFNVLGVCVCVYWDEVSAYFDVVCVYVYVLGRGICSFIFEVGAVSCSLSWRQVQAWETAPACQSAPP